MDFDRICLLGEINYLAADQTLILVVPPGLPGKTDMLIEMLIRI